MTPKAASLVSHIETLAVEERAELLDWLMGTGFRFLKERRPLASCVDIFQVSKKITPARDDRDFPNNLVLEASTPVFCLPEFKVAEVASNKVRRMKSPGPPSGMRLTIGSQKSLRPPLCMCHPRLCITAHLLLRIYGPGPQLSS